MYEETAYNEERYWGGFSRDPVDLKNYQLPEWAIGPFSKYEGNPVFGPATEGWDRGRFGGGVHNGSVLRRGNKFYYIYRGEEPLREDYWTENDQENAGFRDIDYICDIGVAVSDDGIHFNRLPEYSPFFRYGADVDFSFEDACVVRHDNTYYLFCNKWNWKDHNNPKTNGVFIATSKNLLHWTKIGLAFPDANEIHRNACVLQNPQNEAVRVDGKFVMYINNGIIAYSDDLIHWESKKVESFWPGGEGCFALADYRDAAANDILLFTGGHHTGHFYAIGEVRLSKDNPEHAIDWLLRPVLVADPQFSWEDCRNPENPNELVSSYRDTIFFTGLTSYGGKWRVYYGGSEVYTCLAFADME